MLGTFLRPLDFFTRQLTRRDRIETTNASAHLAIRDSLDLKRMQLAEFRDLIERQGGVLHQPDGGRLGHERRIAHRCLLESLRLAARAPSRSDQPG